MDEIFKSLLVHRYFVVYTDDRHYVSPVLVGSLDTYMKTYMPLSEERNNSIYVPNNDSRIEALQGHLLIEDIKWELITIRKGQWLPIIHSHNAIFTIGLEQGALQFHEGFTYLSREK